MKITKQELDELWEAPYGAFSRWKEKNKLQLKKQEREKNYKTFTASVKVFEKIFCHSSVIEFKAANWEKAHQMRDELIEQTRKQMREEGKYNQTSMYTFEVGFSQVFK